jgi:hypothetical protein
MYDLLNDPGLHRKIAYARIGTGKKGPLSLGMAPKGHTG